MGSRSSWIRSAVARRPTPLGPIDPEAILRRARVLYGDDIGQDEVYTPLSVFAESCNVEGNLTPFGRLWSRLLCHDLLAHRAQIAKTLRAMPEILDVPLEKPIFVIGPPRTGTTLLHNLLACDAQSRVPLLYEAYAPTRPIPPGSWLARMSIARDRPRLVINELLNPGLRAIHALDVDKPAECFWLLQHTFVEVHFFLIFGTWGYLEWLRAQDLTPQYRYYKQLLQILMYQRSEDRLVLKYPFHSNHLDALLAVFPDARFVQIHRDPAQVVPSMASLTSTLMKPNCLRRDLPRIGDATLDTLVHAAQMGASARTRLPSSRFYDVAYEDFVADPVGTVEGMYRQFGLTSAPDFSQRMADYVRANPQHQYGMHRYQADEYGLSAERISGAFDRLLALDEASSA